MSSADQPALGFVGAGKAGSALAVALADVGYPITAVASRTSEHARAVSRLTGAAVCGSPADAARLSEVLILAVPDGAVEEVVGQIARAEGFRAGGAVLHLSGTLPRDVLREAAVHETLTGVFHPLQALAGVWSASLLRGSFVGVEADADLLPVVESMASDLGATPLSLASVARVPYHLAAVLAANYPLALLAAASELMREAGVPDECALDSLLPLAHGSLLNLAQARFPGALTGPIVRDDAPTVRGHMEYLREHHSDLLDAYRAMGLLVLRTLSPERAVASVGEELRS